MATRRSGETLRFDHGAQYFTVRDECFRRYVDSWIAAGIVAKWDGRIASLENGDIQYKDDSTSRYVGVPGMNSVCRHLAQGLEIRYQTRIAPPNRNGDKWLLLSNRLLMNVIGHYLFTGAAWSCDDHGRITFCDFFGQL